MQEQNKMSCKPVGKLIWQMGLPMILSMVLQAVYNIVDTAFVINMGEDGAAGNLALTFSFPIQLLIIAIGVGTGVGLNALLSKSMGEKNFVKADRTVGNGIFLGACIYAVFLLFGLFGARPFVEMQAQGNQKIVELGTQYLTICCTCSFGAIGFTIFERFLQSTGKTLFSTIAQISGAATNVVLDWVFIYPLGWGVAGAAWATVIGQVVSLAAAMLFHYLCNKELHNSVKNIVPSKKIIAEIYRIGLSAALMQGLLSVMMLGVNLILGSFGSLAALAQGSFGIYYKIMQFAMFACFGLSNTIISLLSFNFGMKDHTRSAQCIKLGILDTLLVCAVITVLFEALAEPLAKLFGIAGGESSAEIIETVTTAIRIASAGYIFMGFTIAVQGVLQALGYALLPLILSALRLPTVWLFSFSPNPTSDFWWTFPLAEFVTAVVALLMLQKCSAKKLHCNGTADAAKVCEVQP